jgi:hypothetical protein
VSFRQKWWKLLLGMWRKRERRKGQEMMRGNHETKAVDAEMKPSDGVYYAKKVNSRKPGKRKMRKRNEQMCVCSEKRQITLCFAATECVW